MKTFYSTEIAVYFGDVDPAGIVYYPTIFHYCHMAMERFFQDALLLPYPKLITEEKLGFPTVNIEADFKKKIDYGEVVEVRLSILKIGTSSLKFSFQGFQKKSLQIFFEAKITTVAVNMETFVKTPIPEHLLKLLRPYCTEDKESD
jgi:4-hydroxybenzoyl-CoA thioesterase